MLMVADTAAPEAVLLWIWPTVDRVTEERPELLMKERPGWMRLACWASSLCTVPPDSGSTPAMQTRQHNNNNRRTRAAGNMELGENLENKSKKNRRIVK